MIRSSVNDAFHSGYRNCPHAHDARFEGDNQSRSLKAPVPESFTGNPQGIDFGMGARIVASLSGVVP